MKNAHLKNQETVLDRYDGSAQEISDHSVIFVQYIHWKPPDVIPKQIPIFSFCIHQSSNWCQTSLSIWHLIVTPSSNTNREWSQLQVINSMVWTVKWNMHHKYPVHIHNGSNSPIRVSTMMLRSNTRTNMRLTFLLEIPLKLICIENPIILMEIIYPNWCLIPKQLLKLQISHDGFTISKRQFIFNPNNSKLGTIIDITSMKTTIGTLSSIFIWQSTRIFDHKLIHRYKISGLIFMPRRNTLFVSICFFLNTPGDSLFSPEIWHYAQTDNTKFVVEQNLGLIIGGNMDTFPKGS